MAPNKPFNRIALMGRQRQNGTEETLKALHDHLTQRGYTVVFEEDTAHFVSDKTYHTAPGDKLNQLADLIIVVGGDGSLLQAAQIAISQSLPILGVNRGRLGFLTDIYPHELAKIDEVLKGYYQEEARFLLRAEVMEKHPSSEANFVEGLNEVVLFPSNVSHMIEFEVMVNQHFVCAFRADGLIIATPTGSTAYALSGGGPIVHPDLNAIVMVPMFPHTLTNRPIVLGADNCIFINISAENKDKAYVSADGQRRLPIPPGNTLYIQKKSEPLRLIHPLDYNYFETLRAKLHWQSKHPQI